MRGGGGDVAASVADAVAGKCLLDDRDVGPELERGLKIMVGRLDVHRVTAVDRDPATDQVVMARSLAQRGSAVGAMHEHPIPATAHLSRKWCKALELNVQEFGVVLVGGRKVSHRAGEADTRAAGRGPFRDAKRLTQMPRPQAPHPSVELDVEANLAPS